MALVHSRVHTVYYLKSTQGSGGCGSTYSVHEEKGLNHRFDVWKRKEEVGEVEEISADA
jgi:tRNA-specific adenosine deaminase 3